MSRNILTIIFFAVFTSLYGQGTDYIIFKKGNSYVAKNRISGSVELQHKDASVLIQKVLNNLQDVGGNVELMSGKYPLTNQLIVPAHVRISGSGSSTVVVIGKTSKIESAFYSDSTSKVTIQEMTITSEDPTAEQSAVIFNNVGDCLVKDVFITGMGAHGIWFRGYCFLSEIRGCQITGSGKSGILLQALKLPEDFLI